VKFFGGGAKSKTTTCGGHFPLLGNLEQAQKVSWFYLGMGGGDLQRCRAG